MTDLRTAAQQALEALEAFLSDELRPYEAAKTSTALRAALAQQAEPVEPVDVGLLEYRGNSVAFIHQKMTAYRTGIDAAWDALRANGLHPDGKTSLADMIAKYTAPPQQAEPVDTDCHTQGICQRSGYGIGKQADPQIEDRLARHGIPKP